MCNECLEKIKSKVSGKTKYLEGIPIYGYFSYEGEIQKLIRAIKYHNKKELALPLAKILAGAIKFNDEFEIVPVPLHEQRQKHRKYNHAELIASHMGVSVNTNLIKRIKNTRAQYKLSQKERKENLAGAFRVFPGEYPGKKIVLLDDICTTGATMRELISELGKNGINDIAGVVMCFTRD